VQPCDEDEDKDDCFFFSFLREKEHRWNEIDRGKPKYSGKNYPSVTLSTTNPTWTDLGSNPRLRGERPATNHLRHDTAFLALYEEIFAFHSTLNIIATDSVVK
jgi:hypothetical protein